LLEDAIAGEADFFAFERDHDPYEVLRLAATSGAS
jgi:hypothetical protein